MNKKYQVLQTHFLWGIDVICIILSYLMATHIRYSSNNDWGDKTLHYMVCIIMLLICTVHAFLWDSNKDYITRGSLLELMAVIRFNSMMLIITLVIVYFLKWSDILSRFVISNFLWMVILSMFVVRVLFKTYFKMYLSNEANAVRVVVVAERNLMEETIRRFTKENMNLGYKVIRAYCTDKRDTDSKDPKWYIDGVHIHEGIDNLTGRLITDPFDEVFINTPNIPQKDMQDIIMGFEEMGVTVHYNLELPDGGMGTAKVGDYNGYSVITYTMAKDSYRWLWVKRLVDILGGLVGLVLTGIITLFLAPAIKLDSPGPVFFSQTRIGKNGRRFKIYKFRSMYIDAEERKKELMDQNEMSGLMFKMKNDPRITKVGAFIRKTSLDEFPQFLNVLKGDMSLVGTRPPTEAEFEQYNEHYRRRISMTPGLTGLWQISGRSDIEDFDEVVRLDLKYIDNWNLLEDFKILAQTALVVLFGKGAK
ncbi:MULTISPECIES: sugar transferase [unclassified Butyrivibrio]|uniref:sugar transferase n=1 Tax=unclassified Butyrivibrio TaxID=2639466 RepID=UPI00089ED4E8|nr:MULTISPECIES: sugar transferase [unclassified Butyrivibrio]MBE5839548.1 sugar transferase [Butyrivibrio sp.]SEG19866.1 exopolysaccharide biosynthesis polyprenyl glycosylphosphotransferase [Butyrivibrio sp. Su6]